MTPGVRNPLRARGSLASDLDSWARSPRYIPAGPSDAAWLENQRRWAQGWRGVVFPGVFLLYLIQTAGAINKDSSGIGLVLGYVVLVVFCVCYMAALPTTWDGRASTRFWLVFGFMIALCAIETLFAHDDAFVMVVYIVVLSVAALNERSLPVVVVLTAIVVFLPPLIPSWHAGIDTVSLFTIPLLALAMFGFFGVIRGNRALSEARCEVERLATENERTRIARDLHDLLGHSLTTITVKAGLARRLSRTDPERAAIEIAEVETLSRQSLAEVRAAVSNYREVTLARELATAAELLRAAGIEADLPGAVDGVTPANQELFGWILREGLTNVVRHAHATTCTVAFGPNSVEIVDNGIGTSAAVGSGLLGLRERVEAVGGTIHAGPVEPAGWQLRVDVPSPAVAAGGL